MKHRTGGSNLIGDASARLDSEAVAQAIVIVIAQPDIQAELAEFDAVLEVGALFENRRGAAKLK